MSDGIAIVSIEDETEIAELLAVVLDNPAIHLISCATAHDGLTVIRETHPALVIIDIVLPDMDGWTVYDAIRSDPEIRNTPIVMLTAFRREFQARRQFRNGPLDAYITKPFDTLELRGYIEHMLGQKIW